MVPLPRLIDKNLNESGSQEKKGIVSDGSSFWWFRIGWPQNGFGLWTPFLLWVYGPERSETPLFSICQLSSSNFLILINILMCFGRRRCVCVEWQCSYNGEILFSHIVDFYWRLESRMNFLEVLLSFCLCFCDLFYNRILWCRWRLSDWWVVYSYFIVWFPDRWSQDKWTI